MNVSKITILILFVVFGLAAIAYTVLQPKHVNIYGRALVLAFIDVEKETKFSWEKFDLSLKLITSCDANKPEKVARCIYKSIENAIEDSQSANKKLIILAGEKYANSLVNTLDKIDMALVDAAVLLNPSVSDVKRSQNNNSKILIVNSRDELMPLARNLARNIRDNNTWVWSTRLVDDGRGLFMHPVLPHMVSYMIGGPVNPAFKIEFDAESSWQQPQLNNATFWSQDKFIQQKPVTNDIQRVLKAFYAHDSGNVKQWPLKTYHAFNLLMYRDSLPEEKQGRYVTFANRKGHKFYLDLDKYGEYVPEFVIGLDDEDNLYRLASFYKTKRYYTWEEGGPSKDMLYVQALGAFMHFQKPLPRDEELPYLQYSSVLFESITFTDENPYENIKGLSDKAYKVVTLNCIPCHSVHGVGGAAYHLDSKTVKPQPGFANPLLSYSKSVLENFFFNQTATAKLIGVNPNYVEHDVAVELIDWLQPEG